MKSSSGAHYIALDHVRALAAFMVFTWHFTHGRKGYPIPFDYVPSLAAFPLSLLDEGHTGVALFMTLSGYLFAKLLNGRSIRYSAFLWNRALRLLPLLFFVLVIVGITVFMKDQSITAYARRIVRGAIFPTLPNGGWSITVEFHFYVMLPLFLWMFRKSSWLPLSVIVGATLLRLFLYHQNGHIQSLAYKTIVGRVDQFVLGMLAYHLRTHLTHRHRLVGIMVVGFMAVWWHFNLRGGYHGNPTYRPLWVFLPTVEAMVYAAGIAWYDNSFRHSTTGLSRFIGRIGEYSYSIYLLHFFFVFSAARFVDERIMDISNFYLACLWSLVLFMLMVIPGYLSFRVIEGPFLKLRKRYCQDSVSGLCPTPVSGNTPP